MTPGAEGAESWEEEEVAPAMATATATGINYYDLHSLLAKIELRICPDLRSSATRVFWDYATHIFGLSRRG